MHSSQEGPSFHNWVQLALGQVLEIAYTSFYQLPPFLRDHLSLSLCPNQAKYLFTSYLHNTSLTQIMPLFLSGRQFEVTVAAVPWCMVGTLDSEVTVATSGKFWHRQDCYFDGHLKTSRKKIILHIQCRTFFIWHEETSKLNSNSRTLYLEDFPNPRWERKSFSDEFRLTPGTHTPGFSDLPQPVHVWLGQEMECLGWEKLVGMALKWTQAGKYLKHKVGSLLAETLVNIANKRAAGN